MGLMDKLKVQAQVPAKLDTVQAKRSDDSLLRELGAAYLGEHRQSGTHESVEKPLAALDANAAKRDRWASLRQGPSRCRSIRHLPRVPAGRRLQTGRPPGGRGAAIQPIWSPRPALQIETSKAPTNATAAILCLPRPGTRRIHGPTSAGYQVWRLERIVRAGLARV